MRRASVRKGSALVVCTAMAAFLMACATTDKDTGDKGDATGSEFDQGAVPDDTDSGSSKGSQQYGTVYFAFDRSDINDAGRATLSGDADAMSSAQMPIVVQGYTDDRGTEEYNLALGDRRANSVRSYLINLGVQERRLKTVSYGEADPAVQGQNEAAWAMNRRVTFKSP